MDVFCKTILLAPPAMGRPKFVFIHAEKVLKHLMLCCFFFLGGVAGVGVSMKIMFLFIFFLITNYFGFSYVFYLATLFCS